LIFALIKVYGVYDFKKISNYYSNNIIYLKVLEFPQNIALPQNITFIQTHSWTFPLSISKARKETKNNERFVKTCCVRSFTF